MTEAKDIIEYLRTHLSDLSPEQMRIVRPYLAEYAEGEQDLFSRFFGNLCKHLESKMREQGQGWPWELNESVVEHFEDGRGWMKCDMMCHLDQPPTNGEPFLKFAVRIQSLKPKQFHKSIQLEISPLYVMKGYNPGRWYITYWEADRILLGEIHETLYLVKLMRLMLTAINNPEIYMEDGSVVAPPPGYDPTKPTL